MQVKTHLAMIPIMVRDQDEALHFYTEKLGLEKRTDMTFGPGMRWLTVASKDQRKPEIALAKPDVLLHGQEWVNELMECAGKNISLVWHTDDCHRTYETLLARGVRFVCAPTEQLHGVEAIFKDPDGNTSVLLEPHEVCHAAGKRRTGTAVS
jgi:predicted enzyme related to lactoylglutathione lyase